MTRIGFLALVAAACSKPQPPAPYAGPITAERLLVAHERVGVRAGWDDAIAAIEAEAGQATSGAIDARTWAVIDAGKCTYLTIRRSERRVSSVEYQPPIGPDAELAFDACAARTRPRAAGYSAAR